MTADLGPVLYEPPPSPPVGPAERVLVALIALSVLPLLAVLVAGAWRTSSFMVLLPLTALVAVTCTVRIVKASRVAGAWRDVVSASFNMALVVMGTVAVLIPAPALPLPLLVLFSLVAFCFGGFQMWMLRDGSRRYKAFLARARGSGLM